MSSAVSSNKKTIAKNTLMLYFRMLLVMGVTLYTSRIVLAELGVVDYGIFNVVGGIVIMFSFVNGAMAQSTQRFLSYELGQENSANLEKTFKTAVTIHLIIAGIIFFLAETLGLWFLNNIMNIPADNMSAANWVYQCSIITYVISIIQVPYSASVIAHEKMQFYAYLGIIEVILKLGMAFSIALAPYFKLQLYSSLILIITLTVFLIYLFFCKKKFHECKFGWYYQKEQFKSMSSYAAWSTFGSLAWVGKSQGLNLLLNVFFGPAVNAAYGVANQVNTAVNSFVQNFSTALNPQIVKNYSAENYGEMQQLMIYGAKLAFFLMLIIAFPVIMVTNNLLHLWLVKVPDFAVVFTQLVILNSLIESFSFSMGTGIQATGKIKWYQIIIGSTLLLNIPISYILLKIGFPPPVVFIVSISLALFTIGERLSIMRKNIPGFSIRKFCKIVFLPAFMITLVCCFTYYLFHCVLIMEKINFIVVALASLLLTILLEATLGLNSKERSYFSKIIRSKIHIPGSKRV